MNENKLYAIIWIGIVIFALAGVGAILYSCDRTDERRMDCIKQGRSPAECREAFKGGGQ